MQLWLPRPKWWQGKAAVWNRDFPAHLIQAWIANHPQQAEWPQQGASKEPPTPGHLLLTGFSLPPLSLFKLQQMNSFYIFSGAGTWNRSCSSFIARSYVRTWQCLQPQRHHVLLTTGLHCFSQAMLCKMMPKSSAKQSTFSLSRGKTEPCVETTQRHTVRGE